MSSCGDFYALMHMYIDGELPDSSELFAHLEQCAHCRALFSEYGQIARAARSAPCELPDGLHSGIMLAVARERRRRAARRLAKIALPFAACAAIGLAVYLPHFVRPAPEGGADNTGAQVRIAGFAAPPSAVTGAGTKKSSQESAEPEATARADDSADSADGKTAFTAQAQTPAFPPLAWSTVFAEYIVAHGGGELPGFGGLEVEVREDVIDGWVLLIFEKDQDLRHEVLKALELAGFTAEAGALEGDAAYGSIIVAVKLPE